PISVQRITIRKGSAGRGKFSGGAGIAKTYLVHENGILKWSTEQSNIRPSGAQGGLSGSEAELSLKNSAGETTRLDGCGTIPINAGDTLIIRSAGGGGWGSAD
ncbi:MAG: hydantoinase B/oxoprolinase family protein, partial [Bdellovibrionales bacterium]|nr:hydantoinase B/oxoprolinase family protein [Bdellovibrionales bacterium]